MMNVFQTLFNSKGLYQFFRAPGFFHKKICNRIYYIIDINRTTYIPLNYKIVISALEFSLLNFDFKALASRKDSVLAVSRLSLRHYFDLLGSGWVRVSYGKQCHGLHDYNYSKPAEIQIDSEGTWLDKRINGKNRIESKRIWRLIKGDYEPIDWQLDFKSGYRWSEKTWYRHIDFGKMPGVDVKVPWELARMQHLPQLAFAYWFATQNDSDFESPEVYVNEFQNQLLDFIALNPPKFGVNWACPMDVAIRVSNWLLSYDLFVSQGVSFDAAFKKVFIRSVYEHGLHLRKNLEYNGGLLTNHYLSDIVGLLFVSSYLSGLSQTEKWFNFSLCELIQQVKKQFNDDGSNFEASTSYHRLSAEMVAYATALVLGLPPHRFNQNYSKKSDIFPSWYYQRLEKMAYFSMVITKPNSQVAQVGDNDSGRWFKIFPTGRILSVKEAKEKYDNLKNYDDLPDDALYFDEDFLDHRHLISAIGALINNRELSNFVKGFEADALVVSSFSDGVAISGNTKNSPRVANSDDEVFSQVLQQLKKDTNLYFRKHELQIPGGLQHNDPMQLYAFPDFGLYVYKNTYVFLSIRAGSVGQLGRGGHAHNDQLSLEIYTVDKDIVLDPGTYLYTPLPNIRNQYRDLLAHSCPFSDLSRSASAKNSLFVYDNIQSSEVIALSQHGFIGHQAVQGKDIFRAVFINNSSVTIMDFAPRSLKSCSSSLDPMIKFSSKISFSPGYGKRLK